MTVLTENFRLANGNLIPKLALGTWQSSVAEAYEASKIALANGYRHIDTAAAYHNEDAVGKAVRESGLPREEVYITTKVPAELKTYQEAVKSIDNSLKELDLGYIDLILIHAPRPWSLMRDSGDNDFKKENLEVWRALEEAYTDGKVKAIGVSNFSIDDLQNIFDHGTMKPMANQFIYHIGRTDDELVAFCQDNDVLVEGYSPIGTGRLLGNTELQAIADKYDKSIPQLAIRYLLEKNILPLPKSVHEKYIIDNAKVDFEITPEDMATLDKF
ncbi:aldo/keto reductase family protein [Enterococcus sp. HY326]|uniref:aldo/keto reductase family protein n=1 Tax=Enterococcus sp. HY326 TaxID=2971265 RepID=UPI00223FDE64|nr:aldo/keto reductase [Enterococcus sp. HY326]